MLIGVHFGNSLPQNGGAHVYLTDLLNAFARLASDSEHQFVLLCDPADARIVGLTVSAPNVKVIAVPKPSRAGRLITWLKYWFPLSRRIWRKHGLVEQAAHRHGVQLLWFVGSVLYECPDVPFVATMLDLQHRIQPFFPEVSSRAEWDAREQFFGYSLRRSAFCVTGTETGKREIEYLYQVPGWRIRVMPLPTPAFALNARATILDVQQRFGIVGKYVFYPAQFWSHKNHVNLILALKWLKDQRGLDLTLVLTGSDKGNLSFVRSFAEQHGMADKVRFLGFVSEEELIALYRQAMALTYVTYFGPDNIPPLEAFALGCPVIASEVSGAREQYGDCVLYVDPSAPESIAKAIEDVYSDMNLRTRLVAAGYERAKRWTSVDYVKSMFDLFDEFSAIRRNWP